MSCCSTHRILSATFGEYSMLEAFSATIQESIQMWTPIKTGSYVTNRCEAIDDYDLNVVVEYIALMTPIPKMTFDDLVFTLVKTGCNNGTITVPNLLALDAGFNLNNQTNSESQKFKYEDDTGVAVDPIVVTS